MAKNNFIKLSYEKHELHFKDYAKGGKKEERAKSWFNTDTVDSWSHARMYSSIDPLLLSYPEAKWLTVGDGRYGKDAHYIQQKGLNVLATDISDVLLKEAKEIGYITDYRKENAESLSFSDGKFDFVLCKESYHHFPRPMIALYEMLRVCKKGVVLIEPNDPLISTFSYLTFTQLLFANLIFFRRLLKGKKVVEDPYGFEEVGNYCYSISKREIEKISLGLNLSTVAFKELNGYYIEGVEYEKASKGSKLFKKIKSEIRHANFKSAIGLQGYGLLVAIIFKEQASEECQKMLIENNYEKIELRKNPYISH